MLTRRTLLQDICAQNCTMSTTLQPSYECRREYLLIQYWPTDTFYPASITEPPQALFHELKNRLGASTLMKALGVYPILSEPVIV
ncbi:hypothetical protein EB796_001030 [Bugula neritina]|uniref:Uncharacterized protein n=1 Tax=Bugula neritina TaxID=10212 RepID=A0A7J7KR21_BUGNE|nr:hypothetical protein EB796_001030 [Bugula neritina]